MDPIVVRSSKRKQYRTPRYTTASSKPKLSAGKNNETSSQQYHGTVAKNKNNQMMKDHFSQNSEATQASIINPMFSNKSTLS